MICERENNLGNSRPMAKTSVGVNLNLTPLARDFAESVRSKTGVPTTTVLERLLEWFSRMPSEFRSALMSKDEETTNELLLKWFTQSMAARGKQIDITEGDYVLARAKLAKQLIDELVLAHAVEAKKAGGEKAKRKG